MGRVKMKLQEFLVYKPRERVDIPELSGDSTFFQKREVLVREVPVTYEEFVAAEEARASNRKKVKHVTFSIATCKLFDKEDPVVSINTTI
jgi:hypothetical protein